MHDGLTHHLSSLLSFSSPPPPPLYALIRKHQCELVQLGGICLTERWATGAMTPGLWFVFPRLNGGMLSQA